jgi:hypothetical protein
MKMGILLKSGAVPAAVSLNSALFNHRHCPDTSGWEGQIKRDKPEDLPEFKVNHSFRDKSNLQ